jgi:hypothetical protein
MDPAMHRWLPLLGLALLLGCGDGERPPTTPSKAPTDPATGARAEAPPGPPSPPAKPTLRLVGMTDLNGYLEPCGCQKRPLGGIDKAASELARLRSDGVPVLFVAAGDLFFDGAVHASAHHDPGQADASTQEKLQARALARILDDMDLRAFTPGPADLKYGADTFGELVQAAGAVPLAGAARMQQKGAPALAASRVLDAGGVKVGLWGLSDFAGAEGVDVPLDLVAEASRVTTELRAAGAQLVVGLLRSDPRTARRVAGGTKGLDFLLHGGAQSPDVGPPERIGEATLMRAAHNGHGLVAVDVVRRGDGPYADRSAWTWKAQRAAAQERIDELAARIAGWEKQQGVDPGQLARQKARLAKMKQALKTDDGDAAKAGNSFFARFIELDPDVPGAADVRERMDELARKVNEHNREALAHIAPPPVPRGKPGYVGSERCAGCHAPAHAWWTGHPHGNAYATLVERHKQFNLSCVGCHVTGYNKPGGATVVQNEGLVNVGCESCHGPGSIHVKNRKAPADVNVSGEVPEHVCKQCHVPEHSDAFEYEAYKARLMAPGHGLPLPGEASK